MFPPLLHRTLFLAPLLQNKGRLALATCAIALGVALGYAVQLVNKAAINEFTQAVKTLSGDADLEIRGSSAGFDEGLYPRLAAMPEVRVASPVIELEARVVGRREPLRIVGVDIFRAGQVQPGLVAAMAGGEADRLDFLRPDRIFLSAAAADWLALKKGERLDLQVGLGRISVQVAGVMNPDNAYPRLGMMDIAGAQWKFERLGVLSRIDLRLRPGVDAERFAQRLRAALPPGVIVEAGQAEAQRNAAMSRAYRVNLNVLALVALFTGGLVVFSAQALSVVRRRPQLALLRVLGVTRRGLVGSLLAEAVVIGVLGALPGIVLGHVTAEAVLRVFGADLGAGPFRGLRPALPFDVAVIGLFLLLGILVAVAGSLGPALQTARSEPGPALKAGDEQRFFERLQPVWPGLAVLAAGAALTQARPLNGLPLFGYTAIALLLVGAIMLMPRIAVWCFRVLPLPSAAAPRIALAQLRAAPGQASVSLAAIVASVSLMVSMAIMVSSFRLSLDEWLERVLPADLYLRAGATADTAFLSPAEQARIAALPGVRRAEFMRIQKLWLDPGKAALMLLARPVEQGGRLPPLIGAAHEAQQDGRPRAWVSEVAADVYGWRPGQVILLPLAGRQVAFTVAGVWRDYARQQGAVLIEGAVYRELTGDDKANDGALWLQPGASAQGVEQALRQSPGGESIEIDEPGEIRSMSLRIFDRTFAVTYALEAAAVLIALLGLSSSFGALVLARRREFGMLRHIGMTRAQIAVMLASEGALVSALGLAVGMALGWLISLVLIHVVNRQSFHWSMDLHLPWAALAAFAGVMLALATLTALWSGRRAMSAEAVLAVKEDW
jgi:putative ABC transport system permease protein